MDERLISFSLLGQEFSFYSDAPEGEVQEAVALLKNELEQTGLAKKGTTVPSTPMLVLAALRLAARCVNLENEFSAVQDYRQHYAERRQLVARLTEKVAAALKG